jgi:transposase
MTIWAKAPGPRDQYLLISKTSDDLVSRDHPIRILNEVLGRMDWSKWERKYHGYRGQPPIHPRLMAGAILYGLIKNIRSSRQLEEATCERLDFIWYLEGRTIDHSTFAKFRTEFNEQLKDLNRQISTSLVREVRCEGVLELFLDGTRIRANSDRNGARPAKWLEEQIERCTTMLNKNLEEMAREDERSNRDCETIQALQKEIDKLEAQNKKYKRALEEARKRDRVKEKIRGSKAKAVRVPITDPDSTIQPNKDGGFAPNYTPTVAVEGESGAVISSHVVEGGEEAQAVDKLIADSKKVVGKKPDRLIADSGLSSGVVLEKLEEAKIEAYMPAGDKPENPARRPDPSKPVAEDQRDQLPFDGKIFSSAAFIYDADQDCYYCPMGKKLELKRTGRYYRTGIRYRRYACPGIDGCPLALQCVKKGSKRRLVHRDEYQDKRDKTNQRMLTKEGQEIYSKRAPKVEVAFANIKQALNIRQFYLRGLEKVRIEWDWVCGAYNLKKLLSLKVKADLPPTNPGLLTKNKLWGYFLYHYFRFLRAQAA